MTLSFGLVTKLDFLSSDSTDHHRRPDSDLLSSSLDLRTAPVQRSAGHALLLRCRESVPLQPLVLGFAGVQVRLTGLFVHS